MVDQVEIYVPDGGSHGLGYIRGTIDVDPEAWFFKAHFYQDPVWPGSLGLESFLQLLKVVAADRFDVVKSAGRLHPPLYKKHTWVYAGR